MIDFYLFRHGETDWNFEKRCQGSTDIPLNETGRRQACDLGELIRHFELDVIYTSHLKRAMETARIVSSTGNIPVIEHRDLRETFFGEMEGRYMKDIVEEVGEKFWNSFRDFQNVDHELCLPGGETRGAVTKRMSSVLDMIIQENRYSRVGISTHGSALVNLLRLFWEEKEAFPKVENCALFNLQYSKTEGFKLRK